MFLSKRKVYIYLCMYICTRRGTYGWLYPHTILYTSSDETTSVDRAKPADVTAGTTSKSVRKTQVYSCYLTPSKINARQNRGMLSTDFVKFKNNIHSNQSILSM